MTATKFLKFIGVSAIVHFLLMLVLFSQLIQSLRKAPSIPDPSTLTLTILPTVKPPPPPPKTNPQTLNNKRAFIDTADLLKTEKPDPNALFEGESNTRVASKNAGTGNPNLPNQTGTKDTPFSLRESNYSPSNPVPAVTPTPEIAEQQTPKPPQPVQPTQTPQEKASLKQPSETAPASLRDEILKKGSEINVAPRQPKIAETITPPAPATPPPTDAAPRSEPRPPPSAFSADRRLSDIRGGASIGTDTSVATQESELGRYKAKLYRAVGSRWYIYVQRQISQLSVGQVRIKFHVRSNGVIENAEVIQGDPRSMLSTISKRSVLDIGALEPFSPQLKEQLGDGYDEEISFSIY